MDGGTVKSALQAAGMSVVIVMALGAIVALLLVAFLGLRAQRKNKQVPELNQHPERLEQMLDPTDDA